MRACDHRKTSPQLLGQGADDDVAVPVAAPAVPSTNTGQNAFASSQSATQQAVGGPATRTRGSLGVAAASGVRKFAGRKRRGYDQKAAQRARELTIQTLNNFEVVDDGDPPVSGMQALAQRIAAEAGLASIHERLKTTAQQQDLRDLHDKAHKERKQAPEYNSAAHERAHAGREQAHPQNQSAHEETQPLTGRVAFLRAHFDCRWVYRAETGLAKLTQLVHEKL